MLMRTALFLRIAIGACGLLVVAVSANILIAGDSTWARLGALTAVVPAGAIIWLTYQKNHSLLPRGATEAENRAAIRQILTHLNSTLARVPANQRIDVPVILYGEQDVRDALEVEESAARGELSSCDALVAHFNPEPGCTFVVGPPGSGKTTVLLMLAKCLLQGAGQETMSRVPLPLSISTWNPAKSSFRFWITQRSQYQYGIPNFVTGSWLRRGSVILLLDGLDEVEYSRQSAYVEEIRGWVMSARGTKVVVACRPETARRAAKRVPVDSVAALQPLPTATLYDYFDRYLTNNPLVGNAARLLEIAASDDQLSDDLRRPFFLEVMARGFAAEARYEEPERPDENDSGATAFLLGRELEESGDLPGARQAYNAAMNARRSSWRAPAALRLSIMLHRQGDSTGARRALLHAVTYRLESSLSSREYSPEAPELTRDEARILKAMRPGVSYDEAQISSSSLLPPSGCIRAMRDLRFRGLVELVDDGHGNARFAKR